MSRSVWIIAVTIAICLAPMATAGTITGTIGCGGQCENFVVYVEGVPGDYSGEGRTAELGQVNKVFVPHVLPVLAGSTVRIGNDDPFLHNVHAYDDDGTAFNVSLPVKGMHLDQVIEKTGVYALLCDAHPEMSAFIVALDNPFFAQLDDSGAFEILDVPEGSYDLVVFDVENDEKSSQTVTVGSGEMVVSF